MTKPRITNLTAAQEALLIAARDEWLAHGLSTAPADRPAAAAGVCAAYRAAGLAPPPFIIWLGSPLAGVAGQAIAPDVIAAHAASGEAAASVTSSGAVAGQVFGRAYNLAEGQVSGQVRGQVVSHVSGMAYNPVRREVHEQVAREVYRQVYDEVYGEVDRQTVGQVQTQVQGPVFRQAFGPVSGNVLSEVYRHVAERVLSEARHQVESQVTRRVYDATSNQARLHQGMRQIAGVTAQTRSHLARQLESCPDRSGLERWYSTLMLGQHWADFYSWFDAMARIGVTGLDPLQGQMQVARSAGWWWPHRHFAVVTERPAELHRDPRGVLHCATGQAIAYPDGWGFYAWHGRRVPEWVVMSPTLESIAREQNVETRRCAIESFGWPEFVARAGTQVSLCADPGNPGQALALYDVPERLWGSRIRLLTCTNGSAERDGTRRQYGLTVPARIQDPLEAAAWTAGLTRDQYAQMQRRT